MAVITTGNHPAALWPGINSWFGRFYDQHPVEYTDLFEVSNSDQNFEKDVETTGFGLAPVKAEGASVRYESETQGYDYNYVHVAYALGYIVTEEEIDDNLYEQVSKTRAQALAWSLRQTREVISANVYNRAFDNAYTFGDGVELLATTHPSAAGLWANEPAAATDLSEAALEDLLTQIMQAQNSKGLKINLMGKSLIVPPALWWEANRIMKTVLQSDSANNDINVLKATGVLPDGIKMNHYLTDSDAWFVRTNCPNGMKAYDRKIKPFEMDNDFDTGNAKAKKYERYSQGGTDPRGLYGSPGA